MKKLVFIAILISLVLALSACGSSQTATATAATSTTMSEEGQLLVGTFKLENTSLAITSTQASSLLALWETLESLASSNTAASQEVDAVVSQIESSMSSEQISSITAMKLTQQDLTATAIDTGNASSTASSSSAAKTSSTQQQAGGPGGNPPSDMGGGMPGATDGQSAGLTQTGTAQAVASQSSSSTNQVSVAMIKAVVELLQKKVG